MDNVKRFKGGKYEDFSVKCDRDTFFKKIMRDIRWIIIGGVVSLVIHQSSIFNY